MSARFFITSSDVITPFGTGTKNLLDGMFSAKSCFKKITGIDVTGVEANLGGVCQDLPLADLPERKLLKMMNRRDLMILLAALRAWKLSPRAIPEPNPRRWGAFTGVNNTRIGDLLPYFKLVQNCIDDAWENFDSSAFGSQMQGLINPLVAVHALMNNGLAQITQSLNLQGSNSCYFDGSTSGLRALIESAYEMKAQRIDGAVVAASHSYLDAFQLSTALSTPGLISSSGGIVPFGVRNSGTVLSEAAAAIVVQRELAKDQRASGAVLGFGMASVVDLQEKEAGADLVAAITQALQGCGRNFDDLDFLMAQASGYQPLDRQQAAAIAAIAATSKKVIPAFAPKPTLGETRDASGLLSLVMALECGRKKEIPPTLNVTYPEYLPPSPKLRFSSQPQALEGGVGLIYARADAGASIAVVVEAL